MDLRHLRTFVTVAERGTVSKASLHLRVAQPALSRQISGLEDELGLKLFERVRRRLVLTSEGEQMLEHCRTVLSSVRLLDEQAQLLRQGESGILRVAATPQSIEGVFSTFLHRYAERRPNVQIKLTEAVGPNLTALTQRGDIHLAIGFLRAMNANPDVIASFELSPIEFLAACNDSFDLGTGGNVDISRLAGLPLLLMDSSFWVRSTFDAACRLAGMKPNIFIETRTPHALLALAEAGHGVAIVPSVLPTHRYGLRIMRITHRRRPLREPLAVLWDKRRVLPPYAKDFCESLAAHMREIFPISQPRAQRKGPRVPR
jgi:DNA-binding transcriptional LysR family regulator